MTKKYIPLSAQGERGHLSENEKALFDDHRLVANAGLILPSTLALRLGLGEPVGRHVDLN